MRISIPFTSIAGEEGYNFGVLAYAIYSKNIYNHALLLFPFVLVLTHLE